MYDRYSIVYLQTLKLLVLWSNLLKVTTLLNSRIMIWTQVFCLVNWLYNLQVLINWKLGPQKAGFVWVLAVGDEFNN